MKNSIESAARDMRERLSKPSASLVVLTGAGISAESGIPTFRDALTGMWARFDPMQLATPEAFEADPKLVWDWYEWRRDLIRKAEPNAGHVALVELEREAKAFTLITQNVDGLHRRAGSTDPIEVHGNIMRSRCLSGCGTFDAPKKRRDDHLCPQCKSRTRPDVVWFGEGMPEEAWSKAVEASDRADTFLCIGTSALVYPAADLPQRAKRAGALLIEINSDATPLSGHADHALRGKAAEVLPRLVCTWRGDHAAG